MPIVDHVIQVLRHCAKTNYWVTPATPNNLINSFKFNFVILLLLVQLLIFYFINYFRFTYEILLLLGPILIFYLINYFKFSFVILLVLVQLLIYYLIDSF